MSYAKGALAIAKKTANGALWALTGVELVDLVRDFQTGDGENVSKILKSLENIRNELNAVKQENARIEDSHGHTKTTV